MQQQETRVWDLFVRVFHWTLVAGFTLAYVTAEEVQTVHVYAGYTVLGLVLLRLVWGFVGSRHARFSDFVYRPAAVTAYVRDALKWRARRYIGHNPAGGLMILLMLATLLLLGATGLAVYGIEEHAGPLAMLASQPESVEDVLEELHEGLANFMVILVLVHVAGVLFESVAHGENLARSMVTGRKRSE